ncbi:ABC transporter permease [Enemella sp. A6]|uniref:ABC transporter permease n=1 Tax=Enemella sp. A6 TaxID=3440152 RepID=UPI003EB9A219
MDAFLRFLRWVYDPDIPFGDWVKQGIRWLQKNADWFFDGIHSVLSTVYEAFFSVLTGPPYWVIILIFAALAWVASSWRLALFTVIGFWFIQGFGQWQNAMSTISLVVLAVLCALLLSIPLGIWAARSDTVSKIVKPVLDLMQTMPAMVYLVPAITIFGIGPTPGAIATLIFAMPPGVRLTELAIRQVDEELVEAGYAFGSTPGRVLRQIQLPAATPTIMAGVNQVIMLALSMVVLAGMAGAGGLGGDVVGSLTTLNVPLGVEAGLAVVIIAIFLDRTSASVGQRRHKRRRVRSTSKAASAAETQADDDDGHNDGTDETRAASEQPVTTDDTERRTV